MRRPARAGDLYLRALFPIEMRYRPQEDEQAQPLTGAEARDGLVDAPWMSAA